LRIVVSSIVNIFGMGIAIVTVGCHAHILSTNGASFRVKIQRCSS
jgi:hypothetical protein